MIDWFCSAAPSVSARFATQRYAEPHGPFVNSEYYPGWLTHWGDNFQRVNTSDVVRSLRDMLRIPGSSVNIYVFIGGTNFGFTSGKHRT